MNCNDCNKNITDWSNKGTSLRYGVYYEGAPICSACIKKRYENHISEKESEYRHSNNEKPVPLLLNEEHI